MKVADLFAGVGGLSQGFLSAGFEVSFAVEFDKDIAMAYKNNHSETDVITDSIVDVNAISLREKHGNIDVIIGGPPCQGFSQKGKRLALDDPRNFLFMQFVRFVKEFRPKYFVLENVPNIVTTSGGYFKNLIIEEFDKLGYSVDARVLNASDFGIPQDRRRAFFIGQLGTLEYGFPEPLMTKTTIKDAIYDLPFIASGEGQEIAKYDKPASSDYQKKARKKSELLYNHIATNHSKIALERLALIPKNKGKEVLPEEHRTKSTYSGTWSRLLEGSVAPTITTRFDTPSSGRFTHPILNRCLTVREAARLQSFPDNYIFYGTKSSQMKQVGNAVPPLLAYYIAREILKNK